MIFLKVLIDKAFSLNYISMRFDFLSDDLMRFVSLSDDLMRFVSLNDDLMRFVS